MFWRQISKVLKTTQKHLNTIHQPRSVSSLKIPCTQFTHHDLSRRKKYLPWQIMNLLSHTKASQHELCGTRIDFMHWNKLWQDYLLFYVCTRISISRQFYEVVCDSFGYRPVPHHNMSVIMRAGYVGNKSSSFVSTLAYQHDPTLIPTLCPQSAEFLDKDGIVKQAIDSGKTLSKPPKNDGENPNSWGIPQNGGETPVKLAKIQNGGILSLAKCVTTFVFVDAKSRRAVEAPEWWKKEYGGVSRRQDKLGPLNVLDIPKRGDYFSHRVKVRWNDTDHYKHVNYQVYVQYCFEAANQAVNVVFFDDGFKCQNDILNRRVKEITVNYARESVPGDNLVVFLWRGTKEMGGGVGGIKGAKVGDGGDNRGKKKNKNDEKKTNNKDKARDGYDDEDCDDEVEKSNTLYFSIEKPTTNNRLSFDVVCQACIKFYDVI